MKRQNTSKQTRALLGMAVCSLAVDPTLLAANKTWDGGGADSLWQTGLNWLDNAPPAAGDRPIFTGTVRTSTTNNLPVGTLLSGISISNPAGAFTVNGNRITLGGDIANTQTLVPEVINLPLTLNATRNVDVVADGSLTLGGVISGTGVGLTKSGGGELILGATNTLDGTIMINSGGLTVSADANLGAVPASASAGRIVINGGALRTTATMTLNANRGIALGPTAGTGAGTLTVNTGTTLTYGGILANNGAGTGGLTKNAFGNLTLFTANSYTGPTVVQNGTLTLDFTRADSAANNIIPSASPLVMGGANAGLGAASYDSLVVNGKTNSTNAQSFNGTSVAIGPAILRANSGASGTANLSLGSLTHIPGGVLNVVTPTANGGAGNITTTTPNTNGIIGGWATIGNGTAFNNVTMGTEFASVDAGGHIVPYTGYQIYQTGESIKAVASAAANIRVEGTSSTDVLVDTPGAGSTTDINTLNLSETRATSVVIGDQNTLRLGRYGSIFKSDFTNNLTWALGSGTTGGANGVQDEGTLTAGGADNTAGEIVFYMNNNASQSQGSLNVEARVTENGSGAVTVVKAGPSSMKLRGHNSYSGGLYLLQGRLQFAGSELSAATGANPDGGGTGPIYVFPGAYLFPSGVGAFGATGVAITNKLFIAGNGTQQEPVGAIRFGNGTRISGDVELIGDSRIGGGNAANAAITGISGKVTGNFSFDIGSVQTINSFISLHNPLNDWTGTTTMNARNTATANGFLNGASEVIPHGSGRGNVVMNGNSNTGTITWDLNGFNETINGLLSIGNLAGCLITNNLAGTTSTLTLGDYDQTATFGGTISDGGTGIMAITKIGGGSQTFNTPHTYTGPTTINAGTLALTGAGSLASAEVTANAGGTFEVSGAAGGFSTANTVKINGGKLVVNTAPSINTLNLSNATFQVAVNTAGINITAGTLTTSGANNVIDISSVLGVTSYPAKFTVIKYTGTIGGSGFNFILGNVPSTSTQGSIVNNVANGAVELHLADGPKPLTWTGQANTNWDSTSTNWLAFGVTPTTFLDSDSVVFDDTATSGAVTLTAKLSPASLTVNNTAREYTFSGPGNIGGFGSLTKSGPGKLTVANEGVNNFTGGITVNGGTLQVGNNGANGTLPAGSLVNNGTLVLSRTGELVVNSDISGTGGITINGSGTVTLGGANTYDGLTTVTQGTIRPGSPTAFGSEVGPTTLVSGAVLDVHGRALGPEPFTVSGTGINGAGAIVNSGADNINALRNVTLAGNTTFGGDARWDIRNTGGDQAILATNGSAVSLTKVGPNQVSLVGVDVEPLLGDIIVQQGMFSVETSTTSLGNIANKLSVAPGATLQFWNTTVLWEKAFELNGNGTTTTLNNGAGDNTVIGPMTLSGGVIVNAGGNSLTLNGALSGSGSLMKTGGGILTLGGAVSYTGNTTVSGGSLVLNANASLATSPSIILTGGATIDPSALTGGALTIVSGQTLTGSGAVNGPLKTAAGSTLSPGGTSLGVVTANGAVTLGGTTGIDLGPAPNTSDVVSSTSQIAYGGTLMLNSPGPISANSVFKLFEASSYAGTFGSIQPATPSATQTWDLSKLAVDGTIKVLGGPPGTQPGSKPAFGGVTFNNGDMTFTGTGGTPNGTYDVLASTDLAGPLAAWPVIATQQFDASGNFNFNLAVAPNIPQRFFVLRVR